MQHTSLRVLRYCPVEAIRAEITHVHLSSRASTSSAVCNGHHDHRRQQLASIMPLIQMRWRGERTSASDDVRDVFPLGRRAAVEVELGAGSCCWRSRYVYGRVATVWVSCTAGSRSAKTWRSSTQWRAELGIGEAWASTESGRRPRSCSWSIGCRLLHCTGRLEAAGTCCGR